MTSLPNKFHIHPEFSKWEQWKPERMGFINLQQIRISEKSQVVTRLWHSE